MYIEIGEFVSTFGIKGELKIYPMTNDIDVFFNGMKLYIKKPNSDYQLITFENIRKHKNILVCKLEKVDRIEDSYIFLKSLIYAKRDDMPKLSSDEFYIFQLIDSVVYDEAENIIGIIKDVVNFGAHPLYLVKNDDKEFYIPGIPPFIVKRDLEKKKIIVRLLEGILEQ